MVSSATFGLVWAAEWTVRRPHSSTRTLECARVCACWHTCAGDLCEVLPSKTKGTRRHEGLRRDDSNHLGSLGTPLRRAAFSEISRRRALHTFFLCPLSHSHQSWRINLPTAGRRPGMGVSRPPYPLTGDPRAALRSAAKTCPVTATTTQLSPRNPRRHRPRPHRLHPRPGGTGHCPHSLFGRAHSRRRGTRPSPLSPVGPIGTPCCLLGGDPHWPAPTRTCARPNVCSRLLPLRWSC